MIYDSEGKICQRPTITVLTTLLIVQRNSVRQQWLQMVCGGLFVADVRILLLATLKRNPTTPISSRMLGFAQTIELSSFLLRIKSLNPTYKLKNNNSICICATLKT
ncbi:hypothetical protein B1L04_04170 [Microcystis aeruginosa KW]|uniref:Uncharacterized protein n=1 Tax=Microcystis aeruginosa KW TaxID=1960155 RepID=A0A1V4BVI3_MICAE|nr:hypothetical protein B1L04_04170 [Microcystis aeruginosa KW]